MSRDRPFTEVLAAFLEARDRGLAPDAESWARRHPEHAEALREHVACEAAFEEAAAAFSTGRPPAAPPSKAPEVAGFTIQRELARGGMGVVFEAEQHEPRRRVALKTMRDSALASPEEIARFRREAQAAADLDHPGVVRIFEVGETDGRVWFTMPLARGGSLASGMETLVGDFDRVPRLVRDVARAVAHGHARGILHRDLKPSNILLDEHGHPLVADFGLAHRATEDAEHRTLTGTVLGTPAYMAPEQARGDVRAIDERTDVWSLGVILWQLLTGRLPFSGTTPAGLLGEVLHGELPPMRRTAPGVPRALVGVVHTCLQRDPSRRYPSMRDLADDLDRFLLGEATHARAPGWMAGLGGWLGAHRRELVLGTLGLGVAVLVATLLGRVDEEAQRAHRSGAQAILADARTRAAVGDVAGAALCFAASDARHPSHEARLGLLAHLVEPPLRVEPTGSAPLWRVAWSPDGRCLAAGGGDGRVHLWFDDGRYEQLDHDGQPVRGLAWHPDGRLLATGTDQGVVSAWQLETLTRVARLELADGPPPRGVTAVVWTDAHTLAAAGSAGGVSLWQLHDAHARFVPCPTTHPIRALAPLPGGRRLLVGTSRPEGEVAPGILDIEAGSWTALEAAHHEATWDIAVHRSGRFFATAGDRAVHLWRASDCALLHAWPHPAPVGALAFAPQALVVLSGTTAGAVRAFDASNGRPIGRPLPHAAPVYGLRVHPDGDRVASVGLEGTLRTWHLPRGTAPLAVLRPADAPLAWAGRPRSGAVDVLHVEGSTVHYEQIGLPTAHPRASGRILWPDGSPTLLAWRAGEQGGLGLVEGQGPGGRLLRCLRVRSGETDRPALTLGPPWALGPEEIQGETVTDPDIVLAMQAGELHVLRADAAGRLVELRRLTAVASFAVSRSGRWLARVTEPDRDVVTVERLGDGGDARSYPFDMRVGYLAVGNAPTMLAVAASDARHVQVRDMARGRVLCEVEMEGLQGLQFVDDDRLLVGMGGSVVVRTWSVRTGMPVGRDLRVDVTGRRRATTQVRLAPSAGFGILRDSTGALHLWDVAWMRDAHAEDGWDDLHLTAQLAAGTRILPDGTLEVMNIDTWRALRRRLPR